jgi:hypothetical protein
MGDGSCRFISENIDSGDPFGNNPIGVVSPYGVWGALSTRSSGELVQAGQEL